MLSFCLLGQLSACAQLEQLSGEHEPLFCSSAISTSLLTLSPQSPPQKWLPMLRYYSFYCSTFSSHLSTGFSYNA